MIAPETWKRNPIGRRLAACLSQGTRILQSRAQSLAGNMPANTMHPGPGARLIERAKDPPHGEDRANESRSGISRPSPALTGLAAQDVGSQVHQLTQGRARAKLAGELPDLPHNFPVTLAQLYETTMCIHPRFGPLIARIVIFADGVQGCGLQRK